MTFMRTIKLKIAYDGSRYQGYQKQPHGNTIQNILEEFLNKVCGEPVTAKGSGRTDAGVHALGQIVSVNTNGKIPCKNLVRASKTMLPEDIVILEASDAPEGFHARYDACWKQYAYKVVVAKQKNPFLVKYAWQMEAKPDVALMNEAAKLLLGKHDFNAFRSTGSVDNDPVRTIFHAEWKVINAEELRFYIAGDGFLYHMVRNIVWSLVQVGLEKRTIAEFEAEINSKRCEFLNSPAPGCGLYLDCVGYVPYDAKSPEEV